MIQQIEIELRERRRGYHLITADIEGSLKLPKNGLLNLFMKHTSAGLSINENADPSVRVDFETIFNKLIPEDDPDYAHIMEGSDDMPAHIKSSLIGVSITIPIVNYRLALGIWQGIYLCEFRNHGGARRILATIHS